MSKCVRKWLNKYWFQSFKNGKKYTKSNLLGSGDNIKDIVKNLKDIGN